MRLLGAILALASVIIATPHGLKAHAAPDLSGQVLGNLTKAGRDLVAQNKTLNTVPANAKNVPFVTLAQLSIENDQIKWDVGNATSATNRSAQFTPAESKNIANEVLQLKPQIFSVLTNFIRRRNAFKNQGVAFVVVEGLEIQRELARQQGNALQKKLSPAYAKYAPGNTTQILKAFDAAIKAYQS